MVMDALPNLDISSLLEQRVTLGTTEFQIRKLLPMDAFDTLELIRAAIGSTMDAASLLAMAQRDPLAAVVQLVMRLTPASVATIRRRLFRELSFRNRQYRDWTPVDGNEGNAFMDLQPFHVYEMLVRTLAVNFIESWRAANSHIPDDDPTTPPPNTTM